MGFWSWFQGKGWDGSGYGYPVLPWWQDDGIYAQDPNTGLGNWLNSGGGASDSPTYSGSSFQDWTKEIGNWWRDLTGATAADEFSKEMSDTEYTRAVEDMINAGLNPYSLGSNANPASTPSGANSGAGPGSDMVALISTLARFALYRGLSHKFASSAYAAKSVKDVVHNVIDDASDASMAARKFDKNGVLRGSSKMTSEDIRRLIGGSRHL